MAARTPCKQTPEAICSGDCLPLFLRSGGLDREVVPPNPSVGREVPRETGGVWGGFRSQLSSRKTSGSGGVRIRLVSFYPKPGTVLILLRESSSTWSLGLGRCPHLGAPGSWQMWDNDPHVLSFPGPGVWPPLPALPLYGGLGSCPGSREGAKEHLGVVGGAGGSSGWEPATGTEGGRGGCGRGLGAVRGCLSVQQLLCPALLAACGLQAVIRCQLPQPGP